MAECSNVFWKKVRRGEIERDEATLASRLLERADIELFSMRGLVATATSLAIDLDHPVYDCIYLALARKQQWRFVTVDKRFLQVVDKTNPSLAMQCVSLDQIRHAS